MSSPLNPAVELASPPWRSIDVVGALVACVVECCLVVAFQLGYFPLLVGVAAHLVVTLLLLLRYVSRIRRGRDGAASLLLAFAVLVAGPFGALGGLLIGQLSRPQRSDVERLSDWYERIALSGDLSATARQADRILTGRVANLKADMPKSFAGVLDTGSVREQQVVLSLIARRFHPDYLPALKTALVSSEPVIRVQAAAVAAKIRVDLSARAEAALTSAADPTQPLEAALSHIGDAEKYVASGLMEEPDRRRAEGIIDGLLAAFTKRLETDPKLRNEALVARHEARLLAQRRYADFRRFRRVESWRSRSGLRFRPITRRAATLPAGASR